MKLNKRNFIIIGVILFLIMTLILIYILKLKNKNIVNSISQTISTTSAEQENSNVNTRGEFATVDDGDIMTITNTNGNIVINSIDSNMIANYDITNKTTSYSVNTNKGNANVTSTEPYIPDGMKVANPNDNSGIKASDLEFNRSPENVKIEVLKDTITNTSIEILITDNNEDYYGWGEEFKVQKKVNNKRETLPYVSDKLVWNSIAYVPNENNQLKQKLNIENYYGKLEKGTYRIVKSVYDKEYIDLYSDEFEIK